MTLVMAMADMKVQFMCIAIFMFIFIHSVNSKVAKGIYWPSDQPEFPPSSIDTSLFTHVYYAFVIPNNVTHQLEIDNSTAIILIDFTTTLHDKSPNIKTLLAIGGQAAGSLVFSRMASNCSTRRSFINSTINVARTYGFDGFDLDWEYPQSPKEMDDLAQLLDEWRQAINEEAKVSCMPPLLLTAAVYFSPDFFLDPIRRLYPVASMDRNMDLINVMCYDYHGSWDKVTGGHAALFDPKSNISSMYGLNSWIKAGLRRHKLVMGFPLYGRTWKLKDPNINGLGAPAIDAGPGEGVLKNVEDFGTRNGTTVVYDMETVTVYSYSGTSWMSYEDSLTVTTKIGFAQALRLGGYFFWAAGSDREWKVSKQASKAWFLS